MNRSFVPVGDANNSLVVWLRSIPPADLDRVLEAAMRNAARGLSEMVGHAIRVLSFQIATLPLNQMIAYAGDPEAETVGIYLLLKGNLRGQAILLLSPADARKLAELLIDPSPTVVSRRAFYGSPETGVGPTPQFRKLSDLERSALVEIGNVMVSYFLNDLATSLGQPQPLYPSPPAVIVDMLGAVLDVVATSIATRSDNLLVVNCDLQAEISLGRSIRWEADRTFQIRLWIMPELSSLDGMAASKTRHGVEPDGA